MSAPSSPFLDIAVNDHAVVVRFVDRKVLNDHKMELMAEELFELASKLGERELRLDFGNVEYLQSSVLGKLIALSKKVTVGGGHLILCNVSDDVYRAFTVTSLDKLFVIQRKPSEPEA
jgi:anti-sigma B factor antagonist